MDELIEKPGKTKIYSPEWDLIPENLEKAISNNEISQEKAQEAITYALKEKQITEEQKTKVEKLLSA